MNGTNFASLVRKYTATDSVTLTDAEIVLLANTTKENFATEIIQRDESYFGVPEYANLKVTDSSDITSREYPLPIEEIKLERVEAKLNGASNRSIKLEELNLNQYSRSTNEAEILENFANEEGQAFFDLYRGSLWLYTGAIESEITAGLTIWHDQFPEDITTTELSLTTDLSISTAETGSRLPRTFHELWARACSIMWKSMQPKPIALSPLEIRFDIDFESKLSAIDNPNRDREMTAQLPDDSHLQM